jgi:hypothetical protein
MASTVRAKRREQEYEIVCHGVDRETFLGVYHDIANLKPEPRVAIRNPDPLTFAPDAVHSLRAIFGNRWESHREGQAQIGPNRGS